MSCSVLAPGLTFEVAFAFNVSLDDLKLNATIESGHVNFQGIDFKLRVVHETNVCGDRIEVAAEGGEALGSYTCSLLASASMTSDWSSSLQKHVLAIKPFDGTDDFRRRSAFQFRVVGKRTLDAYAGFYNLSKAEDGEEQDSCLELSALEALRCAGASRILKFEVYLRGIGPIFFYPTYEENYCFETSDCVLLKLKGTEKLYKAPREQLQQASFGFLRMLSETPSNCLELDINFPVSPVVFRSFLQCLLPPYLPLSKAIATLTEIIGLANYFSCKSLLSKIVEFVIETQEITPLEKLSLGNMYDIPIIAMYGLENIPSEEVENYLGTDEFKGLTPVYKAAVLRRLTDD